MELFKLMGAAYKVRGIVLGGVWFTIYLFYMILQLAIVSTRGQYFIYVPFLLSVNYNW
jgi:hypothetical protein